MARHQAPNQTSRVHRVVLQHGAHGWTFAFTRQDAAAAIRRVRELAADPGATLDRFDAILLIKQIRRTVDGPSPTPHGGDVRGSGAGPAPTGSPSIGDEDPHGR